MKTELDSPKLSPPSPQLNEDKCRSSGPCHTTHTSIACAVLWGLICSSQLAPYVGSAALSVVSSAYHLSWTTSEWQYIVYISTMALICNWIAMIAVLYIARKGWFFPLPELQCSELWTPVGFIQTAVNTPVGFWMLPAPPGVETTLTAQKSIPIYAVGCAIVAIVYYPILYIGMRRERRGCVENVA